MFFRRATWNPRNELFQRVAFAVGGSCICFCTAVLVEDYRYSAQNKERNLHFMLNDLKGRIQRKRETGSPLDEVKRQWRKLRESEKTIASLILVNLAVFAAWQIPFMQPFMTRHFMQSPLSSKFTMFTCTFSHQSLIHLSANMLGLWSFGTYLHEKMGREQFVAFYLSAGLFSSLGSEIWKLYRGSYARSLGASGAVLGITGSLMTNPALQVRLMFLPFVAVPLSIAVPGLLLFDIVGLIRGWQVIDHAAHITGTAFGYLYNAYGPTLWKERSKLIDLLKKK